MSDVGARAADMQSMAVVADVTVTPRLTGRLPTAEASGREGMMGLPRPVQKSLRNWRGPGAGDGPGLSDDRKHPPCVSVIGTT